LRSAVATADADTIGSVLENHAARIGAASAPGSTTAASSGRPLGVMPASALPRWTLTTQQRSTQVTLLGTQAVQLVSVPLKAPVRLGWLVLGFPLDQALADDMKALSGLDLALLLPGRGAVVSTLPAALRQQAAAGGRAGHAG
jgi:hypothetical protein